MNACEAFWQSKHLLHWLHYIPGWGHCQGVHIDFAGPFLGKMIFLLVDAHSKWPKVFIVTDTCTSIQDTIYVLRQTFAAYGIPEQSVSDNVPQFGAKEVVEYSTVNRIKHIILCACSVSSCYANVLNERFDQSFKQEMKAEEGE